MGRLIDSDDVKKLLIARYEGEEYIIEDIRKIPTAKTENKWVPVERDLPPGGEIVHVTVRRGYVEVGYYDDVREEWWKVDDEGLLDVIAWHPAPDPYKEAEG